MPSIPAPVASFLQEPYELSQQQIAFYDTNRFIKLKHVLNEETLQYYAGIITERVHLMNRENRPLEQRSTYGKAFLQLFNLWREDERIKALVFSRRIAKIACDLMQTRGAKLYHDQALYKEPGGGITPWHADQYYWPLETDKTITAWMPLQAAPLEMGPLEFSAGSHIVPEGRELEISDESERRLQKQLRINDFPHIAEAFEAGEISFHSGWIFHRAGANNSGQMRKAMTVIYMDEAMRLKQPDNENQVNDWNTWCPGAKVGEVIATPLNPVLFSYTD
jgi:ectoine hydroxylase-related dioxygenase (phytanoyl-CoA dioxygenase family)